MAQGGRSTLTARGEAFAQVLTSTGAIFDSTPLIRTVALLGTRDILLALSRLGRADRACAGVRGGVRRRCRSPQADRVDAPAGRRDLGGGPRSPAPVPPAADEVSRLGTTLNAMLVRLEEALAHESRFVSDASHELRTPLGIVKTELELALRGSRTPAERREAIRSAGEENQRVIQLAEDLLVLARVNQGQLAVRRSVT